MFGYMGKLLFVDLTKGETTVEPLDEEMARQFMGGPGLGAKILYDRMPAHADVFGDESMIGFISGPLNNTNALFGGRYTVVSKSPVTGGWNDANSGGYFGQRLKQSGFDAIFVRGIAQNPVYLLVDNGKVSILDASALWGMTVSEAEQVLGDTHGKEMCAALIGPAGENMSHMAAVMNDRHRAAARGGSGAVMGSKKLKAVVVKGNGVTPEAEPRTVKRINRKITKSEVVGFLTDKYQRDFFFYGTGGTYVESVKTGDAGVKNWAGTNLIYGEGEAKQVDSQALKKYKSKKFVCSQCHIGCSIHMKMDTQRWGMLQTTRPEYETMGAFGSMMLNQDAESICMANELCNQYGFDTMSAGSTLAWAMECYEKGVLTKEELGGVELMWGDGTAMVEVLKQMCENRGIGAVLSKGSQKAAEILSKGAEFLVVASGIEEPQHDSRYLYGLGRTYMADPTPGRHVKAAIGAITTAPDFDPETSLLHTGNEDAAQVVQTELMNASGACAFGFDNAGLSEEILQNVNAVTGFQYGISDLVKLGERIFIMRQAFNLREGIRRSDFTMSKRMTGPSFDAALEDNQLDFGKMVDSLYQALGWSREGIPTPSKLLELGGLEEVIRDLHGEIVWDKKEVAK